MIIGLVRGGEVLTAFAKMTRFVHRLDTDATVGVGARGGVTMAKTPPAGAVARVIGALVLGRITGEQAELVGPRGDALVAGRTSKEGTKLDLGETTQPVEAVFTGATGRIATRSAGTIDALGLRAVLAVTISEAFDAYSPAHIALGHRGIRAGAVIATPR